MSEARSRTVTDNCRGDTPSRQEAIHGSSHDFGSFAGGCWVFLNKSRAERTVAISQLRISPVQKAGRRSRGLGPPVEMPDLGGFIAGVRNPDILLRPLLVESLASCAKMTVSPSQRHILWAWDVAIGG